jgi:hypothetical protein
VCRPLATLVWLIGGWLAVVGCRHGQTSKLRIERTPGPFLVEPVCRSESKSDSSELASTEFSDESQKIAFEQELTYLPFEFGRSDASLILHRELLQSPEAAWRIGRTEIVQLSRSTSESRIRPNCAIVCQSLTAHQSTKLNRALELQRLKLANNLSAKGLKATYQLAVSQAMKQLLLASFSEWTKLEVYLDQALDHRLAVDASQQELERLRLSLLAKAVEADSLEMVSTESLHQLFPDIPAGKLWPNISLWIEPLAANDSELVEIALQNRVELQSGYEDDRSSKSDSAPILECPPDIKASIAAEVRAAAIELRARDHSVLLHFEKVYLEQKSIERLREQEKQLGNTGSQTVLAQIELYQAQISLLQAIADYFVSRIGLEATQGIAAQP